MSISWVLGWLFTINHSETLLNSELTTFTSTLKFLWAKRRVVSSKNGKKIGGRWAHESPVAWKSFYKRAFDRIIPVKNHVDVWNTVSCSTSSAIFLFNFGQRCTSAASKQMKLTPIIRDGKPEQTVACSGFSLVWRRRNQLTPLRTSSVTKLVSWIKDIYFKKII